MTLLRAEALTEEGRRVIRQALWDMNLTPDEFLEILEGRAVRPWPSRGYCAARLLESVNWFRIVEIFRPEALCALWAEARPHVRLSTIREGMDYACRILH